MEVTVCMLISIRTAINPSTLSQTMTEWLKNKNTIVAIVEEAVLPTDHQDHTTMKELKIERLPNSLEKRLDLKGDQPRVEI